MSVVIIKTRRLLLRTWNEHYGKLLHEHCNTPEVMKHLGGPDSPKKHREMVDWLIWQQRTFGITFWALERRKDGEFLGFCGLVRVDEAHSTVFGCTEIGWRLRAGKDFRGKKYAKEAALAVLAYAFSKQKELRVVSRTIPSNSASWGLMKALKMTPDPRLDYLGKGAEEGFIVYVKSNETLLA